MANQTPLVIVHGGGRAIDADLRARGIEPRFVDGLRVTDAAAPDTGTLGCAQIELKRRPYLCCPFAGGTPVVGAVPPAAVTAESCGPGNAAADPDETISVSFPLQNIGRGPTVNLQATLLPGGGVNTPSGPQSYGPLSPVGPAVLMTPVSASWPPPSA